MTAAEARIPGAGHVRQAAVLLRASGVLAGCGLGEPDQTYQQAYGAMYPAAEVATKCLRDAEWKKGEDESW